MAEQDWKTNKATFAAVSIPTLLWVVVFFVVPMAIVWFYSFGENKGLTEISISGTLENYKRATEWLYLTIFGKSFAVAALVTLICLIIGFPVAMAITFASEKWRPWLLLGIMLPFWTNLLIRTYALMMLLGTQGYANKGLGALWEGTSWIKTLVGLQPLPTWEPMQLLFNNFAVVFGLVYSYLPFMVLPLYATLERMDRALIEAANDLGCRPFPHHHAHRRAARGAGHHRRGDDHPDPRARRVPHPRPDGRHRQPDDRQCHRTPVQESE